MVTMIKGITFSLALLFCFFQGYSQNFLNGDFENTTAVSDIINTTNANFNANMANTVGFGTWGSGNGNLDIITSTTYGLGPQSGSWYIAMTGGGSDQVTMQLSGNFISGNSYNITWYDNRWNSFTAPPLELGVTATAGTFGTLVHSNPGPVLNTWTQRSATFTAPLTGQFLSVRTSGVSSGSVWTKMDNFSTGVALPFRSLSLFAQHISNEDVLVEWWIEGPEAEITLERADATMDFVQLGRGEQGDSGDPLHFVFSDLGAGGDELYYRLKFTDVNGQVTYSKVYSLAPVGMISNLNLYPNPASDWLQLDLGGSFMEGKWEITVHDLQGKQILHKDGKDFSGEMLDVSGFESGLFILKLVCSGMSETRRFKVD